MAESLLFRKGSLAGLENANLVAGAVSFTTDEPAIYLDVQEKVNGVDTVVRKRIGDLITVSTMDELVALGANESVHGATDTSGVKFNRWSTTALYYVVNDNALLKWTGTKWNQINSISDVEANVSQLEQNLEALDEYVKGDGTANNTGLEGRVTANANAIAAIKDHGTVDSFADVMKEMAKYQLSGDYATKAEAQGYANAAKTAAVEAAKEYTDGQIDLIEAEITGLKNTNNSLDTAVKAAQKTADDITALVGKSTDKGNSSLYGKVNAEIERSSGIDSDHATRIGNLEATINTGTTGLSAVVAQHGQDIEGLKNKDTIIEGNVAANTKAITDEIARADAAEKANAKAIADEATRADTEEKRLAGLISGLDTAYKAADVALDEKITSLNNTVNTNKQEQTQINADIRKEFADADKELKEYLNTQMAAADAMKYMGVVNSAENLPTTAKAIEAGWTYKVGADFAANDKIDTDEAVILKGDLLIASVDLAKGATIPNDFWHHISSGYEDDKDQVLVGSNVAASGTQTAGAQVVLKSHTGDDRGSIAIVGTTNSNVRVTNSVSIDDPQTGDTSTIVTLSLEWGEF